MDFQAQEELLLRHVSLRQCGWAPCAPGHQYGPAVRDHYLIHYVLSGEGIYQTPRGQFPLKAGQGFIIFPGEVTTYQANRENPWTYGWVGYAGHDAAVLTGQVGLTREAPVFYAAPKEELFGLIETMCREVSSLRLGHLSALGSLYRFLALIAQSMPQAGQNPHRLDYEKARWFMEGNYTRPIRISDIAAFVGLSRSQLFRVFEEICGCSPKESLYQLRMEKALSLIAARELNQEAIAASLGISSAARFGRLFKQYYGLSPRAWCKQQKIS